MWDRKRDKKRCGIKEYTNVPSNGGPRKRHLKTRRGAPPGQHRVEETREKRTAKETADPNHSQHRNFYFGRKEASQAPIKKVQRQLWEKNKLDWEL